MHIASEPTNDPMVIVTARLPKDINVLIGRIAKRKMRTRSDIIRTLVVGSLRGGACLATDDLGG